jgi:hypothetical protein
MPPSRSSKRLSKERSMLWRTGSLHPHPRTPELFRAGGNGGATCDVRQQVRAHEERKLLRVGKRLQLHGAEREEEGGRGRGERRGRSERKHTREREEKNMKGNNPLLHLVIRYLGGVM